MTTTPILDRDYFETTCNRLETIIKAFKQHIEKNELGNWEFEVDNCIYRFSDLKKATEQCREAQWRLENIYKTILPEGMTVDNWSIDILRETVEEDQ